MRMMLFELARESRAIFPQLAAVLREKTGIDIGYEEKEFIVLLKMKMRRKEFFTLWIGAEKTGEDSYFLTGDHVREKSHIYPNLL